MLNSAEHEIFSANKYEKANNNAFIVGIFIFISREEKISCSPMLTLILLFTTTPISANSVDPDQMASEEAI